MRVTSIEMHATSLEEIIDFSLRKADPGARYMVRDITGIDAAELISKFYGWSQNAQSPSDSRYYALSMAAREIVMRVMLNPQFRLDESYSDVRDELYRSISSTRLSKVDLHFKAGATTVAHIVGNISRFEVPYFVKSPEVQLTINCEDPMFRGLTPVVFSSSELSTTNPVNVPDSYSTSPHGFAMELAFHAASPSLVIQDEASDPNWTFTVTPSGGFLNGDVLYFSSEFSNKYLYLMRGETTIELVDKISPASIWPIVFPGSNLFYFTDITKFNWRSISYYASYWGV